MKRPLKPSEVPPGSAVRNKGDTSGWKAVTCVYEGGLYAASYGYSWEIAASGLEILRPGESWQPCYVEEFSVDDYKPGQEVDIQTARKLFAAGVKMEYVGTNGEWDTVTNLLQPNVHAHGYKFRVAAQRAEALEGGE